MLIKHFKKIGEDDNTSQNSGDNISLDRLDNVLDQTNRTYDNTNDYLEMLVDSMKKNYTSNENSPTNNQSFASKHSCEKHTDAKSLIKKVSNYILDPNKIFEKNKSDTSQHTTINDLDKKIDTKRKRKDALSMLDFLIKKKLDDKNRFRSYSTKNVHTSVSIFINNNRLIKASI